ncbi:glycosyltransferase family 2 protein [Oceanibaculum sp.]|uniref:glycosyltransferase family 2 protein n=1 Tax=Oceanibaculum sp. TaxID=1903597 RepID=UPI00258C5C4A|nr:glycosyltransferase family 2 protein [Oceanibaculum sp.]MCH2394336.1 glycosyltransferase [Oceanibaculum sp.]
MSLRACILASCDNAPYLAEAIASVRAQSLPFEAIVIADDASTDSSRDLIRVLAAADRRIVPVLRERRLGPGANRDLAIRDTQADWIVTLDGDDVMAPGKHAAEWAAVLPFAGRAPAIGFSDVALTDAFGAETGRWSLSLYGAMDGAERTGWFARRTAPIPRDMLLPKAVYLQAGGFAHDLPLYEDWDFKLRLSALAAVWRHSGIIGTRYRRQGGGLSDAPPGQHERWQAEVRRRNRDLIAAVGS